MKPINRTFEYTDAAESAKPGYLKRKFERIRKEQAEKEREAALKVTTLPKKVKA